MWVGRTTFQSLPSSMNKTANSEEVSDSRCLYKPQPAHEGLCSPLVEQCNHNFFLKKLAFAAG